MNERTLDRLRRQVMSTTEAAEAAARLSALEQVAEAARDLIAADDTDDETLDAYIIRRATFEEQRDAAAACDAAFNRLRDALAGLGADTQENE